MVKRLAWFLAFAGAVPFLLATAALFVSDASSVRVPAIAALVTYAAVILSFLAGIEWGLAIRDESGTESTRAIALGLSTVSSLAAWAVLWLPSPTWQVGSALALFVAVWGADQWMAGRGLLPTWFVDLRTVVSALVAAILAVALFRL
ncbi:MAG: DUF3429 domain-containing protein [Betaproteobacteria bacterium]|jgi:Protein of unknown function (DUF3429)|nr:DUF3429 domain-containing protein [Betaproteobacteria bacterium]